MSLTAVQTSVDNAPQFGQPGMPYDSSLFQDVVSKRAVQDIPAGAYVQIVGGDCDLPGLTGEVSGGDGGVALSSHEKATGVGYKAGDMVPVMRVGRVWVYSETAATDAATPYIRFTANTAPTRPIGGFLNGADSGKAVQRTGITVVRGIGAAGNIVIQLNAGAAGATGATGPTGPTGP